MTPLSPVRRAPWPFLALLLAASFATAQSPATPPASPSPAATAQPPVPATPPSPVNGMRNKISAGDLLSAESILEVHREKNGEDGPYLVGLSWLARGALLTGDLEKAKRYGADARARCGARIAKGDSLEKDRDLETAWGAATEVEAQLIAREKGGERRAAEFLRSELRRLEGPIALRSRLNKRLNMLSLTGSPAPEIEVGDFLGEQPPTLASLRGKPVLLFLWAEWCGDCRSQAAALARTKARYADQGLQVVAVTRYYDKEPERIREKARVDSVWKADYSNVGTVPVVFSTPSMERYGASSTPTLVFVDRAGIVRRYTPTRLTEAEMDRTVATMMR